MGLLTLGKPLPFEESKQYIAHVREHGIQQFLNSWDRVKDISQDLLRWGDEIECGIFKIDPVTKSIKLSLRSELLREVLESREESAKYETEGCLWHPEWGCWMIESTPSEPYSNVSNPHPN